MKTLYFDVEHGSQTLGSKETIGKHFGLPMLSPSSWDEFQTTIGKLYTNKKVTEKIDMGNGFIVDQSTQKVVPKDKLQIDTVVVDTFSELSKKFMRTLTDKSGRMKLNEWGRLKNKLDTCLEFLTRLPGNVILTCHSRTQTMDSGENKLQPYIDGSTKEDISKWFDFVFYTKTIIDSDGKRKYIWVTNRTETYDHAKDRTQLLDAEMEQDFTVVFEAAKKKGFEGSKILIIGSPGSGKTYSLKTLVNYMPQTSMEQAADAQDPTLINDDGSEEDPHNMRNNHIPEPDSEYNEHSQTHTVNRDDEETQTIHSSNGTSERQVAYLRGETHNIEEVSNANTNS